MKNKVLQKDEYYILKDHSLMMKAELGNVQSFNEADKGPRLNVLLRNIKALDDEELLAEKQWVDNSSLARVAKTHMGEMVTFKGHCLQYVVKTSKGPKLECYISKVTGYELIK